MSCEFQPQVYSAPLRATTAELRLPARMGLAGRVESRWATRSSSGRASAVGVGTDQSSAHLLEVTGAASRPSWPSSPQPHCASGRGAVERGQGGGEGAGSPGERRDGKGNARCAHEGGGRTTNRVSSTGSPSATSRVAGSSEGMSTAIRGERAEQAPLAMGSKGTSPPKRTTTTGRGKRAPPDRPINFGRIGMVLKVNPVSKCQQTPAFKTPHPFQKILLKPPIPDPKQAVENLVDPPLVVDSAARLRV